MSPQKITRMLELWLWYTKNRRYRENTRKHKRIGGATAQPVLFYAQGCMMGKSRKQAGTYWCDATNTRHKHASHAKAAGVDSGKEWAIYFCYTSAKPPTLIAAGLAPPSFSIDPAILTPSKRKLRDVAKEVRREGKTTKLQRKTGQLNKKPRKRRPKKNKKLLRRNTTPPTVGTWWADLLKQAGFDSYDGPNGYLDSRLWANIKKRVIKQKGNTCIACKKGASQVHHREYNLEILKGENLIPLVPICRRCHPLIHLDGKGNKRTLAEANKELDKLSKDKPIHWTYRPTCKAATAHIGKQMQATSLD